MCVCLCACKAKEESRIEDGKKQGSCSRWNRVHRKEDSEGKPKKKVE